MSMKARNNIHPEEKNLRLALSAARGKIFYSGGRTYLGSLDDSVSRHPWDGLNPNLSYLNRMLIDAALFGSPLCVRVGNLLYQDNYLDALLYPEKSPLLDLAQTGFVQIQMKSGNINDSIRSRVDRGTQSTLNFVKKYDWSSNSEMYRRLEKIDSNLIDGIGKIQYSADFSEIFRMLMNNHADEVPEFVAVFDKWKERPEEGPNNQTRDNFERDAIKIFNGNKELIKKAMWVANAANHWAYGNAMLNSSADRSTMPMVETVQYKGHNNLCGIDYAIPAEQANEILGKNDPINKLLNTIQIPEEVYHPSFSKKIANMVAVNPSGYSQSRADFLEAKFNLASKVGRFLEKPDSISKDEILKVSKNYEKALYSALNIRKRSSLRMNLKLAKREVRVKGQDALINAAIGSVPGALFAGPQEMVIGFSIGYLLEVVGFRFSKLKGLNFKKMPFDGIVDVNGKHSSSRTTKFLNQPTLDQSPLNAIRVISEEGNRMNFKKN